MTLTFVIALGFAPSAHAVEGAASASIVYVENEILPEQQGAQPEASTPPKSDNATLIERQMREAAARFEEEWAGLPSGPVKIGARLKRGRDDPRIGQVRHRLGLSPGTQFDRELANRINDYRDAHGLRSGTDVDNELIVSLNRGYDHYKRIIDLNIARIAAITVDFGERFVLVDAAEQRLYMYAHGEVEKSMRVIVGKESDPTPMMVGQIRYSVINPYWNVPVDLTRRNIAPKVLEGGKEYLVRTKFEALSDWTLDAKVLDNEDVDWQAVANGDIELRVRQRPGPGNGMGEIKFMFPNDLGIYLHDTPSRALFDKEDRAFSAGCVRLEDAWELAKWLYGERPETKDVEPEQIVLLEKPVPIYITYLTAVPTKKGFAFREDFYGRDAVNLAIK